MFKCYPWLCYTSRLTLWMHTIAHIIYSKCAPCTHLYKQICMHTNVHAMPTCTHADLHLLHIHIHQTIHISMYMIYMYMIIHNNNVELCRRLWQEKVEKMGKNLPFERLVLASASRKIYIHVLCYSRVSYALYRRAPYYTTMYVDILMKSSRIYMVIMYAYSCIRPVFWCHTNDGWAAVRWAPIPEVSVTSRNGNPRPSCNIKT